MTLRRSDLAARQFGNASTVIGSRGDDASASQVSQVSADFWLMGSHNFHKETDAEPHPYPFSSRDVDVFDPLMREEQRCQTPFLVSS